MRIAVMGAGSWGTTFAMVCADAGNEVIVWGRDEALTADIRDGRNERYLPGIALPRMQASSDPQQVLADAELIVLAVPSRVLREHLRIWRPYVHEDAVALSLIKGIELGTSQRMTEVIAEEWQRGPHQVAALSGPNLAHEIAVRQPAATTVACADEQTAMRVQHVCATGYLRPYRATDVVGTEIGGAVKNVIAVANGIAVGMGLGTNTQASLITRGLAEMTRLGVALGAAPATFSGLAGMGDLVATCTSDLSRNRTFGVALGRGATVEQVIAATRQTCEGVVSAQPILDLARAHGVDMPITEQIVHVVHDGLAPSEMLTRFMARDIKSEH